MKAIINALNDEIMAILLVLSHAEFQMPKLKDTRRIKIVPAKKTTEKGVLEFAAPTRVGKIKIGSLIRIVAHNVTPTRQSKGIRFTYGIGQVKKIKDQNVEVYIGNTLDDGLTYEVEVPVYDGS